MNDHPALGALSTLRARHSRSSGFTLIEVIISLSIMVFVCSVMYTTLEQVMRTKGYLDEERDLGTLANTLLNRLTRELQLATSQEHLMPPRGNLEQKYPETVDLLGKHESMGNGLSGDSITFLANDGGQYVQDGLTHSGLVQITYRVAEDPEQGGRSSEDATYYLIRDEVPYSRDYESAYKKIMTFPITRDLLSLEFMYYDGEKWATEWDDQRRQLPRLVRFTLKIRSTSGKPHTFSTVVPIGLGEG